MKYYYIIYTITLLAYNIWSVLYIRKNKRLEKDLKIVVTLSCMVFLGIAAGVTIYDTFNEWWKWIFIAIPSVGVWATFTDALHGAILHKKISYLGDAWPDNVIKKITHGGWSYMAFKFIFLLVTIPLLSYVYEPIRKTLKDEKSQD